jgi:hypothetical protein
MFDIVALLMADKPDPLPNLFNSKMVIDLTGKKTFLFNNSQRIMSHIAQGMRSLTA